MEKLLFTTGWASWGSIFAGSVAALAISVLFAVFGVALGFAVVKPKSDDPASGLGVAFGGWSFLSIVASMAAGGYIAGLFASQRGAQHGFMVWALVTIAACCFSSIALGSALKALGIALKNIGSGAAGAVSAAGKHGADMVPEALSELRETIKNTFDPDAVGENVMGVLRDTEIKELQPENLQRQMREIRADLRELVHQLALRPTDYEGIISGFLSKEKGRLDAVADSFDKEGAVKALMKNRNLPEGEARTMVDNAVKTYDQVVAKARSSVDDVREQVEELKKQVGIMTAKAREKADKLSDSAAKVAMMAGVAMIVAAAICIGAGWCGAEHSRTWLTLQGASIMG